MSRMEVSSDGGASWEPWNGTVTASPAGASGTANVTNVAASVTSVTLLAANALRKGAIVFNSSTSILYLKCAATAASNSFTAVMAPNSEWVLDVYYTGIISGIWVSANGSAGVTEFV